METCFIGSALRAIQRNHVATLGLGCRVSVEVLAFRVSVFKDEGPFRL